MRAPEVNTGGDITTTVGSAFSTLLAPGVYRITTDTPVRFGTNTDGITPPSATDAHLEAGATEYFEVIAGRYFAVLATSAGGIFNYVKTP